MADKQISQLVAASTINNDDLFVMQQGGTAKKLSGQKLSDFVYQSAADQIERVNEAVEQTQAAVDALEEQKNEIAQTIASMAELGTDTTLSTPGMAADAAATGEVKDIALARFEQAEITGVPVATFDDGADNVPVKKLIVNIDPVQDLHGQTNPWPAGGGKNLIPFPYVTGSKTEQGVTFTVNSDGSVRVVSTGTGTATAFFDMQTISSMFTLKAGTYTVSMGTQSVAIVVKDSTNTAIMISTTTAGTTTLQEDTLCFCYLSCNSSVVYDITIKPMLNAGSSAEAFAPYSNICPITGWTGANVTRTGKNLWGGAKMAQDIVEVVPSATIDSNAKTVSFTGSAANGKVIFNAFEANTQYTFIMSYGTGNNDGNWGVKYTDGTNVKLNQTNSVYVSTAGKSVESLVGFWYSGTTILNYEECGIFKGVLTASDFEPYQATTYSITFQTEAGTVYGGTLDVMNGVLTVNGASVDLGTLEWTYNSGQLSMVSNSLGSNVGDGQHIKCSNYKVIPNLQSGPLASNDKCIAFNKESTAATGNFAPGVLVVKDTSYSDAATFKTAMSGVQLVYELATPITYTLTPTEVRTLLGPNNIWADTGNIDDLIYRKMPIPTEELENTIESMIAGVEDTMEATQNYTADRLVVAAHHLYHTTANIAAGETLVPGTNCYVTTIADELANLASVFNTQLSLLGNVSTLTYQVVT